MNASVTVPLKTGLARTLSPQNVWAIALGAVIGFGCFVLPGSWLAQAGPGGTTLGLLLGGLMMLPIGGSFGAMVRAFPVSGGPFAFAYYCFGRYHAFICGWMLAMGYLAIVALNATALPILFQFLLPELFDGDTLYSVAGFEVRLVDVLISSTALFVFTFLNYRGSRLVGLLQLWMVAILVASLLLLGIAAFVKPVVHLHNLAPAFPPGKNGFVCVLTILAIAPWAFVGFDTIPHAAEEFSFSPGKAGMLISLAILFGTVSYILVNLSTAVVFPWVDLVESREVWATGAVMRYKVGKLGELLLFWGVSMAIFTGINGFLLTASRLLYAMARARALPAWFGKLHPRYRTPVNSLLFILVICLIAPWFGRNVLHWVVEMSSVGIAVGYAYTCLAALKHSRSLGGGSVKEWLLHGLGCLISFAFLLLLCLPGMPTFMVPPSWCALVVWLTLGGIFFVFQGKKFRQMDGRELEECIFTKPLNGDFGEPAAIDDNYQTGVR